MNAYQDRTFIIGSNHDMIIKYYDERGRAIDLSRYNFSYISFKNLVNNRTHIIRNIVSFLQASQGVLTIHIDSESFPSPTDRFFETNSNDSYGYGVPYHAYAICLENRDTGIKEVVFRGKATSVKAEYDGSPAWQSTEPPLDLHLTDLEQIIVRVNQNTADIVSTRNLIGSLRNEVTGLRSAFSDLQTRFNEALRQLEIASRLNVPTITKVERYENNNDEERLVTPTLATGEQALSITPLTDGTSRVEFMGTGSNGSSLTSFTMPAHSASVVYYFKQPHIIQV